MIRRLLGIFVAVSMLSIVMVGCDCRTTPPDLCEGVNCKAGRVCINGLCIKKCDKTLCGDSCTDTKTDSKHCGKCNNACSTGTKCDNGVCKSNCKDKELSCSGICVDPQTNKEHCGQCGATCKTDEVCKAGKCELNCPDGTTKCSRKCVDVKTDITNCGACGTVCKQGEVCKAGKCELNCPKDQTICSGACIDTQVDRNHCGACDKKCKAGDICKAGKCELQCPTGQTICGSVCVNTQADRNHCGACDKKCKAGDVCSVGTCALSCQSALTNCSGNCVNVKIDVSHCGGCANACKAGQLCVAGACKCPTGTIFCSGVCVNVKSDPKHCGQCGNLCKTGEICVDGTCGVACKSGETNCSNACYDLQTNNKNCGVCGKACGTGSGCCTGVCTDLQTNNKNCGVCGKTCSGRKICTAGACQCPTGEFECGGKCIDVQFDDINCGACNNRCSKGKICSKGACRLPWAVGVGGLTNTVTDEGWSVAKDSSGNLYITGRFQGTGITFGTTTLKGGSSGGVYVVKLNSSMVVQWAVAAAGTSSMWSYDLAVDSSGSAYITGYFYSSATFGSTTLSSKGSTDVYVAKVSPSGAWMWAKSGGGTRSDYGQAIALDSSNNIYLTGQFYSTALFGSSSLISKGGTDLFVTKMNSNGAWMWAVSGGSFTLDYGYGVGTDGSGNVYVAGSFYSTLTRIATFGSLQIRGRGGRDAFVAKLNSRGVWQWVAFGGGTSSDYAYGLAVDKNGNSYVTGYFYTSSSSNSYATFASGSTTFRIKAKGSSGDIFVGKLNTSGVWQWVKNAGGGRYDYGRSIALDATGNLYVTGSYQTYTTSTSFATFGSYKLKSTNGSADMFVAKLSNSGAWQWAVSGGGTSSDYGYGVAVDGAGNASVIGHMYSPLFKFGSTTLKGTESADIFVANLNTSGGAVGAKVYSGVTSRDDSGYSVAVDSKGNIYVTGAFAGTANFGSTTLTSASNGVDIFVGKLSPGGQWLWAHNAGSQASDYGFGIALDASDNVYITGYFGSRGFGDDDDSNDFGVVIPNGAAVFGSFTLLSRGGDDIFVASLDKDGKWLWVKNAGSRSSDQAHSIAVDSSNNIYITGYIGSSGAVFGTTTLSYRSSGEIFVSKLSNKGNWLWTKQGLGTGFDRGYEIRLDKAGDAYIAGHFSRAITFGSLSLSSTSNSNDIFVGKIDKAGVWKWVKSAGGTSSDYAQSLALDSGGNLYVTGYFSGSSIFGTTTLSSTGGSDVFVAYMDKAGTWKWAKKAGGTSSDYSYGISTDSSDNAYLTGYFPQQATFGTFSFSSAGKSCNIFVARVNKTGAWTWAQAATSNNSNCGYSGAGLHHTSDGKLYVTGRFDSTVKFGNTTLTSKGRTDIFVWQILP